MSKRLQVVMDDAEYEEIQETAADRRLTTSAWVRQVLRRAREEGEGADGASGSGTALPGPRDLRTSAPGAPPAIHGADAPSPGPQLGDAVSGLAYAELDLVRTIMRRHGLPSIQEAIRYALRRAAGPAMIREEMLELRGTGWAGDLDAMR